MPAKAKKKNVKKLNMPKVEILENTEDISIPPQPKPLEPAQVKLKKIKEEEEAAIVAANLLNPVAKDIEPSVIIVPIGTNIRQIRIAFEIKTNKIRPKDIKDVVETVLLKAAPKVGELLVQAVGVEKSLIDATR